MSEGATGVDSARTRRERLLRPIELEVRGQHPDLLGGIGVADHHLEPAVVALEPPACAGKGQPCVEDRRSRRQLVTRLE